MKTLKYIALIGAVLFWQFYLIVLVVAYGEAGDLNKIPFRREERYAVVKAMRENPSPENKAAFEKELRLASTHDSHQMYLTVGIIFGIMVGIEAVWFWPRLNPKKTAPS